MPRSVSELRNLLQGRTWADVCNSSANIRVFPNPWFYGRVGCFLRRPCIAVCAENQFVVLKYNTGIEGIYDGFSCRESRYELDATPMKGITLFVDQLEQIHIDPNSLVLDNTEGD